MPFLFQTCKYKMSRVKSVAKGVRTNPPCNSIFGSSTLMCLVPVSYFLCAHTPLQSGASCVFMLLKIFPEKGFYDLSVRSLRCSVVCRRLLKLSRAVRALPFFVLRFQSSLAEVWRQSYQRNTCTTCKPRFLPLPKECTAGKTRTKLTEMGQRSELDLLQWSEQVGWGCAALCTYKVLLSRSSNWALRQTNTVISSSSF